MAKLTYYLQFLRRVVCFHSCVPGLDHPMAREPDHSGKHGALEGDLPAQRLRPRVVCASGAPTVGPRNDDSHCPADDESRQGRHDSEWTLVGSGTVQGRKTRRETLWRK